VLGTAQRLNLENLLPVTAEHDNLRLALAWFDAQAEPDGLLRLGTMLFGLWFSRGLHREGLQWIERGLAQSTSHVSSVAAIQALIVGGALALIGGDYSRAETFLAEGLTLARGVDEPELIGEALTYGGLLAYRRGEYARAEEQQHEAYRLMHGREGSMHGAHALLVLGDIALAQERFDMAATTYQEAITHFTAARDAWGLSDAQAGLAGIHYCTGDLGGAGALYAESLQLAHHLNLPSIVASALFGLAGIAAATEQPVEGAQLLGAAEEITVSIGAPTFPRDQPILKRGRSALIAALGEERFAAEREAGRTLLLEAAIAKAEAVAVVAMASAAAAPDGR
jgi:non-specific serine/threonine protein kinase